MLTYDNYAKQILDGTFSNKEPYYYGPLYFYFLALIYKIFGIDAGIARLIQMLLGVLTTFLTYFIAKKVFNKTVGYISLIISILYGMFYIHEGVLLMESLVTFLNILTVFLLLRVQDNPSYKNFTYSGISLGLSALARANILLFVPFILIWMLKNSKLKTQNSKLLKYGFLCLITLLTISPATIRNYLASGKFVLISTNGPVSLWIGNNPYASGEFKYPPSPYNEMIAEKVKEKGEKVYIGEVVSFIKKEPKAFIKLLFKKFLLFWSSYEIDNNLNSLIQRNYSTLLKLPIFLGFGSVGILALVGIILSIKFSRKPFLLYVFLFSGVSAIVIIFVLGRYKICFLPIFIVFAGFALYWWYEKIREKKTSLILLSLIPLFFSSCLVYSQAISNKLYPFIQSAGFHIKEDKRVIIKDNNSLVGYGRVSLNNHQDAIRKDLVIKEVLSGYKEARIAFNYGASGDTGLFVITINNKEEIPIKPMITRGLMAYCEVRFMANLLKQGINTIILKQLKEGNVSIVVDESSNFKRSYIGKEGDWKRLRKGEYMIWLTLYQETSIDWAKEYYNYGMTFFANELYESAIDSFKKSLEFDPRQCEIYSRLGLSYEIKREFDNAIETYKAGIRLFSDKNILLDLHNSLARVYYAQGKIREAIEECQKILAISPGNNQAYNNLQNLKKLTFSF